VNTLQSITKGISLVSTVGNNNPPIETIRFDSRGIQPNDIFVAVKGFQADGHQFIEKAF